MPKSSKCTIRIRPTLHQAPPSPLRTKSPPDAPKSPCPPSTTTPVANALMTSRSTPSAYQVTSPTNKSSSAVPVKPSPSAKTPSIAKASCKESPLPFARFRQRIIWLWGWKISCRQKERADIPLKKLGQRVLFYQKTSQDHILYLSLDKLCTRVGSRYPC